jgi:type I restriction enzyme S subunit
VSDKAQLPAGWVVAELRDVVDVANSEREPINATERAARIVGKPPSSLFRYYGATGQVGWIDSYRSEGERVLLGEDGAPFLDPFKEKAYVADGRFWVNNHAHVLRGASGHVDNRFLCHFLNTVDYQPFVSGSTRLKLTSSAMGRIPVVLPPTSEQRRIVDRLEQLLSDLDAGVAELETAQKKLARYRQSLLKAAVEGTLTADWRAERAQRDETFETGPQLLERILRERRTRWEEKQLAKFEAQGKTPPRGWRDEYATPAVPDTAGLPPLPLGWVWATLEQLSLQIRNGLSRTPNSEQRGFPILRINAVRPMSLNLDEIKHVDLGESEVREFFIEPGDLLATRYNGSVDLLGVVALVRKVPSAVLHPDKLIRIKPVLAQALGSWIEIASNTGTSRSFIAGRVKTTAGQTGISGDDLKKMPIPLPPISEQAEIANHVERLRTNTVKQAAEVGRSLQLSHAQRQNILRAAFSGRLVPQDPADEPASALRARIRAERAKQASSAPKRRASARTNKAEPC